MKSRVSDFSYRGISHNLRRRRGHQQGILMWVALAAILLAGLMPALNLWKNCKPDDHVLLLVGKSVFYLVLPFVVIYLVIVLFFIIANILFGFRKGSRIEIRKGDYTGQTGTVMEKHEWFYSRKLKIKLDSTGEDIETNSVNCKKTRFL